METRVLPAQSLQCQQLLADGWELHEESFGAQLEISASTRQAWADAMDKLPGQFNCRILTVEDLVAVLALDDDTIGDYPGGPATAHRALSLEQATPTEYRHGYGIFVDDDGEGESELAAMTWVDLAADGASAEVDFTVVARQWRGLGLATAVKSFSLQTLLEQGVSQVRTGGSMRNRGIISANASVGFRIDERWVTLARQ